ncbi:hypothetical protein COV15_01105 [Candidatus Woesearchaeota archaeon CG10_big_fil_rev_8_21_14_0_10_34_12]|nr:MAG: hypothetical protein COV15_01105 [Candidatus Woesearchaeota archaeon CG10_big_fil_rev_8_21_14_0_10_34_12]
MKNKLFAILGLTFVLLSLVSMVSASELTNSVDLTVSGVDITTTTVSGLEAGETVPVRVVFTATEDVEDVRVKVWLAGYRDEVYTSTSRFDILNGSTYSRLLSLTLPGDIDLSESYNLNLRIEGKDKSFEQIYSLKLQRQTYNLDLLSVDVPTEIEAGSSLPVNVVVKNRGLKRSEDVFIVVRIPSLGVERKVYAGDVVSKDSAEEDDDNDNDAVEKTIYLSIPEETLEGHYTVEVTAYDSDSEATAQRTIKISGTGSATEVLAASASKTVKTGDVVSFDVVLVNTGSNMKIYSISASNAVGLNVEVSEPILTVSGDSSKIVKVTAKPNSKLVEGTYVFSVNVSEDGKQVKTLNFNVNVEGRNSTTTVVAIVLAVILVVLVIVLIVLLTRPQAKMEVSENYY